jgi:transmembrane sensor
MVSRISFLIAKFNRAELSVEEQLELNGWISHSAENASLFAELTDAAATRAYMQMMDGYNEAIIRAKIEAHYPAAFVKQPKLRRIWYRVAAAAAVLVLLGSGIYFYFINTGQHNTETKNQIAAGDIPAPKNNRATITLAGGQKVFLDSLANGTLAKQGNVQIKKNGDGIITYNGNEQPKNELLYNTLNNPRGSKVIDITLSDGTQVWLNAESSLKYPVVFTGKERKVEITGEA